MHVCLACIRNFTRCVNAKGESEPTYVFVVILLLTMLKYIYIAVCVKGDTNNKNFKKIRFQSALTINLLRELCSIRAVT